MIVLRAATAADQPIIKRIINEAGINPMGLSWPNFLLAVDEATGEVVGTGQIKPHGDGSRELASIATAPAYQRQGIAHLIIERLLADNPGDMYLTCVNTMGPFYVQFGFREIDGDELTPYFRRLKKMAKAMMWLDQQGRSLWVMKRDAPDG